MLFRPDILLNKCKHGYASGVCDVVCFLNTPDNRTHDMSGLVSDGFGEEFSLLDVVYSREVEFLLNKVLKYLSSVTIWQYSIDIQLYIRWQKGDR